MTPERSEEYLNGLVAELRDLPTEAPWAEFKTDNANPEAIGQYVSALANSAALHEKPFGYLVWGIADGTHDVVGTTFDPFTAKKGNENLENWLTRLLDPQVYFRFHVVACEGQRVVVLEVARAADRPVQFSGVEWIRHGSYRKPLRDRPELARVLWRVFDSIQFELLPVAERLGDAEVLALLDAGGYQKAVSKPAPTESTGYVQYLADERLIVPCEAGGWNITALGAILFARDLDEFPQLTRKAVRVIQYEGTNRIKTKWERVGKKGYAIGFAGLIKFLTDQLPKNEVIAQALRTEVPMYPTLAVRELVANALIHQDFTVRGAGPMIEIFSDRMEITNPGRPLVNIDRFLDTPPQSRNEALASFMRRIGICEERGSGVDKVVFETEYYQLPAPLFETMDDSTRVVLFAHKELRAMDRDDRTRACYLHACLRHVERDPMTNSSLRVRFGIAEKNSAIASRIIAETLAANLIKPYDPEQGKRFAKYLPWWA